MKTQRGSQYNTAPYSDVPSVHLKRQLDHKSFGHAQAEDNIIDSAITKHGQQKGSKPPAMSPPTQHLEVSSCTTMYLLANK